MTFKEELEKLIKENFYDDHENCDDSCGKKADYTELITSIINLVDKELPEMKDRVEPKDIDMGLGEGEHAKVAIFSYRNGYNKCIEDMRNKLKEK